MNRAVQWAGAPTRPSPMSRMSRRLIRWPCGRPSARGSDRFRPLQCACLHCHTRRHLFFPLIFLYTRSCYRNRTCQRPRRRKELHPAQLEAASDSRLLSPLPRPPAVRYGRSAGSSRRRPRRRPRSARLLSERRVAKPTPVPPCTVHLPSASRSLLRQALVKSPSYPQW